MKNMSMRGRGDTRADTSVENAVRKQADTHHVSDAVDAHRDALKAMYPIPLQRAPRAKRNAATAAVLTTLLAIGLWWIDPAYRSEHFVTQVGDRSVVELADGSKLVLDTATELTVDWHVRSRRVTLADGRAHFDVMPSGWRPFFVDAGVAQVRVVGTRFDVWHKPNATRVSVYEGKVAVWRTGNERDRIALLPGQQTEVSVMDEDAPALKIHEIDGDNQAAWKDGRLVFLNTSLADAIAMIQRYRQEPILVTDQQISRLTISGVFDSSRAEQLIDLLPGILPVRVVRRSDGSAELSAR